MLGENEKSVNIGPTCLNCAKRSKNNIIREPYFVIDNSKYIKKARKNSTLIEATMTSMNAHAGTHMAISLRNFRSCL